MRRRPPVKSALDPVLLQEGRERADDLVTDLTWTLREADPVDQDLAVRMQALEHAAVRATRGDPELIMPVLVAAREAVEAAAGAEGLPLRTRIRWGDEIFFRLLRRFHTPSPPARQH